MESRRLTPVRQSLCRPMLLAGAERELVVATGMIAAILIFALGHLITTVAGIALWLVCFVVLQRMAKYDPHLSRVFIRHMNKRPYYPAAAGFNAPAPKVMKHQ
ncbi:MAG TPA: conjugal transfer protein TrbD [Candidatus Baltobacteraceae bacterium]|jgi:type IV secretion system protein VirB3|nr:conjugal transfer protein TrbD [Candidatus Baltobacteraceae bacterium]